MKVTARDTRPSPQAPWTVSAALIGLITGITLWLLWTIDPSLGWGGDDAMYLMHARNIVGGLPYNLTGYIQNPTSFLAPQSYPPGFPLLLAPVYAVSGLNIVALKIYMIGLYAAGLFVMAGYFRHEYQGRNAALSLLVLIALIGLNPQVVANAVALLSDGPFLICVMASLWALRCAYDRLDARTSSIRMALLAGLLIGFAISTRIFGLLLLPSVVVYELTRYRRLTPVLFYSGTIALLVWGAQLLWTTHSSTALTAGADTGYAHILQTGFLDRLAGLPATIGHNLHVYVWQVESYWTTPSDRINRLVDIGVPLTLLLAAWGFIRQVVKRYTVAEVFCFIYLLGLLPWDSHWNRYLLPVIPLYLFYMLAGLNQLIKLIRVDYRLAIALFCTVVCVPYATSYALAAHSNRRIDPSAPNGVAAGAVWRYIRSHTPADAVILFRKPRIAALYTHRHASTFTDSANPVPSDGRLIAYMRRISARYALQGPHASTKAIRKLARDNKTLFERVYKNPAFELYEFHDGRSR